MALTIREQVTAAILTALEGIDGVTVERLRDVAVTKFPALVLYTVGQNVRAHAAHGSDYRLTVIIEGYVKAREEAAAHTALNALYGQVVTALAADVTLGGLSEDLVEGDMDEDFSTDGSQTVASFSLEYECLYTTASGDPETLGPA